MKTQTKADLIAEVARLKAELRGQNAISRPFYTVRGYWDGLPCDKQCVAVPLHALEAEAVAEWADDQVASLAGEGREIETNNETTLFELTIEESPLPVAGMLIRYNYNRQDGSQVTRIWKLVSVL